VTPKQIDRLLNILDRFATVAERWADKEYPKRDEAEENPGVFRVGETKDPQSKAEYDALPDTEPGRFEKLAQTKRA
jgi:hypothetical protein